MRILLEERERERERERESSKYIDNKQIKRHKKT
jgi:hypothetical protein